MTAWRYAAATDVGLVRDVNEDTLHTDAALAVIADGMGGAAAGEVASEIAVSEIVRGFEHDTTSQGLVRAMLSANEAILADAATHPARAGMGTTAVAIALTSVSSGILPVIVNIGDSRAYQLRDGALRQITNDHSVAEEWVRQGRLSPEEAAVHPRRHQLTRTLGVDDEVQPDIFPLTIENGDRILLCSDGLSNELTDDEIASVASAPASLDDAVATLIERANRNGGRDNITAILIEFVEDVAQPSVSELALSEPLTSAKFDGTTDDKSAAAVAARAQGVRHSRRARRFTWRTALFLIALGSMVAAAYAVIDWYGHAEYFLGLDRGHVAVYQGQPGGFLWFKPVLAKKTTYEFKQLTATARSGVTSSTDIEPTLKDALLLAKNLHREWRSLFPPPTTTTTTTTFASA
jgi:PPM family protein phosphatase